MVELTIGRQRHLCPYFDFLFFYLGRYCLNDRKNKKGYISERALLLIALPHSETDICPVLG
jgi:hypothetical protein